MNGGAAGAPMDPMMGMMLMGDDSSSMKDMLPLMMMGQGGQMDPMMMMLMSDDSSDMKELLPLMMMNGGGQMDPMMMMMLLDEGNSDSAEEAAEKVAEE